MFVKFNKAIAEAMSKEHMHHQMKQHSQHMHKKHILNRLMLVENVEVSDDFKSLVENIDLSEVNTTLRNNTILAAFK